MAVVRGGNQIGDLIVRAILKKFCDGGLLATIDDPGMDESNIKSIKNGDFWGEFKVVGRRKMTLTSRPRSSRGRIEIAFSTFVKRAAVCSGLVMGAFGRLHSKNRCKSESSAWCRPNSFPEAID
eukprot:GABV01001625.1.p1 GENE.GABV01001625.1~~GABV01001625.1.p1  ORF type:complete len:124 (+),score=17.09 GABV01001625.1:351-722(+)